MVSRQVHLLDRVVMLLGVYNKRAFLVLRGIITTCAGMLYIQAVKLNVVSFLRLARMLR